MCRKKNFSLIELLIVIGIMMTLISLLVPTLSRALEQARKVSCAGQLRQLALGYKHYVNDYNGYPAPLFFLEDFRPIAPYLSSNRNMVFRCPSSRTIIPQSMDEWLVNTDYLYSPPDIKDIEQRSLVNNGHGNSQYDFDATSPSTTIKNIIAAKRKEHILFDARQPAHFKYINMVIITDIHYEWQKGVANLWTLDKHGRIERKLTPYPNPYINY